MEFAILKIGGGDSVCYKDSQFENNYTKCENADIPKGCYFFGEALTKQKAVEEALTKEGYDYKAVQTCVNQILKTK